MVPGCTLDPRFGFALKTAAQDNVILLGCLLDDRAMDVYSSYVTRSNNCVVYAAAVLRQSVAILFGRGPWVLQLKPDAMVLAQLSRPFND